MRKIKDRFLLGIVSGTLGSIPTTILNFLEHRHGLNDMTYHQQAATFFLKKDYKNRWESRVVGFFTNAIGTSLTGVINTYLLSATGRDHAVLKGIGVTFFQGALLAGIFPKMGLVEKPKKLLTFPLSLVDHIILGGLTGYLVSKLGDDSLFPDYQEKEQEKLPLVNSSNGVKEE